RGGAAAGRAAAAATGATAPAPAAPNNIWSKLCMTPEQCQACKQKLCSCPLVQFMSSAMAPLATCSGGLIPQCCPGPNDPNPADMKQPPHSAPGAASRIKAKEAQAKAPPAAAP